MSRFGRVARTLRYGYALLVAAATCVAAALVRRARRTPVDRSAPETPVGPFRCVLKTGGTIVFHDLADARVYANLARMEVTDRDGNVVARPRNPSVDAGPGR
jgi:hypothetical protein